MVKPILFNTDMVKAILDGRKTVTRRLIKSPYYIDNEDVCRKSGMAMHNGINATDRIPFPNTPYLIGEFLYVRETWKCWRAHRYEATADIEYKAGGEGKRLYFSNGSTDNANRGDYDAFIRKWLKYGAEAWKPSIHMPKKAARIFLRVTNVSVAKLQNITEEEAVKEGVPGDLDYPISSIYCPYCKGEGLVGTLHSGTLGYMEVECNHCDTRIKRFKNLWDFTIKQDIDKYGWTANPWVWVIEFEKTEKPNEWV